MPHLLAATTIALAGLLPLPIPGPPSDSGTDAGQAAVTQPVQVSGVLSAADGRLRRGCKDYHYAYSVTTATDDWTFDIAMTDRSGHGVNAQSLLGPNDPKSGILEYRLCRWATVPGKITLKGALVSYDYDQETTAAVDEVFRLRKKR